MAASAPDRTARRAEGQLRAAGQDPASGPEPGPGRPVLPLADLVRAYLDGVTSIVEVAGPDAEVAGPDAEMAGPDSVRRLRLGLNLDLDLESSEAGGIGYRRIDPAALAASAPSAAPRLDDAPAAPGNGGGDGPLLGPDTLAVVPAGPDPAGHLALEVFGQVLRQLPDGGRGVLLLASSPDRLPGHQILGLLAARNCLILQVAALDEVNFGSAIVFTRVAAPAEASGQDSALRNMNEYALGSFVEQGLRARLADLERAGAGDPSDSCAPAEQAAEADSTAQAGVALERDRLARSLRATQRELVGVYEQLMALERSTSLEIGRAVVGVARHPWREGARLPVDLYRLWRDRGGGALGRRSGAGRADQPGAPLTWLQDQGGTGLGDRWLAAYTVPGQITGDSLAGPNRLVITGALTSLSCATLEPDAVVHPLLPHDADFVLEGTGADLVLIETAAMLSGCAWAFADDPAATDRGRRLAALVSLARSLGKPVVLLRNAGWHFTAGLDWLTASCDAVLDGDLGVQLARFNPIGLDPGRPCEPVYAARRDPREPLAVRRILDELTGGHGPVTVSGAAGWRSAPALYRGHGLFVAADDAQAREQIAAGARVVGPVGQLATDSGGAPAPDAERAAREIEHGRQAGARGPAELRLVLGELFANHATPVRLAELARLLGLPADIAASRQVAVLAEVTDVSHAQRLGHDLMRQRLRPAEVIVSLTGPHPDDGAAATQRQAAARALRPLADAGAVVRVLAETGLPAAAAAARSPWVAPWAGDRDRPDSYLLDLACGLECSRADAVGHAPGADYVFAPAIEPALVRRDLMLPGAPPADAWGRHGLSMLSISP
jgi:hypothetical protein